jgi:hypothetical protein
MIRALLALLVLSTAALAQPAKIQSAPAEKDQTPAASKKMPANLEDLAASAPTPANLPKRTPDEIIATFFDAIKADHVDAAYDTLHAEFQMAGGDQEKGMREQTQKALDAYGPVTGYELVREEKLGTHLMRRTYILTGETLPLRWKFYFYNPNDRWKLIDLRIDDAIAEWFDDKKGIGH